MCNIDVRGSSTVAEYSTQILNLEGSNLAATTEREKTVKRFITILKFVLFGFGFIKEFNIFLTKLNEMVRLG
jgi:hypothetical protein